MKPLRRPGQGLFCWFVVLALSCLGISVLLSSSSSSFSLSAAVFCTLVIPVPCLGSGSKLKWSRSRVHVVHSIRPDSMHRAGPCFARTCPASAGDVRLRALATYALPLRLQMVLHVTTLVFPVHTHFELVVSALMTRRQRNWSSKPGFSLPSCFVFLSA